MRETAQHDRHECECLEQFTELYANLALTTSGEPRETAPGKYSHYQFRTNVDWMDAMNDGVLGFLKQHQNHRRQYGRCPEIRRIQHYIMRCVSNRFNTEFNKQQATVEEELTDKELASVDTGPIHRGTRPRSTMETVVDRSITAEDNFRLIVDQVFPRAKTRLARHVGDLAPSIHPGSLKTVKELCDLALLTIDALNTELTERANRWDDDYIGFLNGVFSTLHEICEYRVNEGEYPEKTIRYSKKFVNRAMRHNNPAWAERYPNSMPRSGKKEPGAHDGTEDSDYMHLYRRALGNESPNAIIKEGVRHLVIESVQYFCPGDDSSREEG